MASFKITRLSTVFSPSLQNSFFFKVKPVGTWRELRYNVYLFLLHTWYALLSNYPLLIIYHDTKKMNFLVKMGEASSTHIPWRLCLLGGKSLCRHIKQKRCKCVIDNFRRSDASLLSPHFTPFFRKSLRTNLSIAVCVGLVDYKYAIRLLFGQISGLDWGWSIEKVKVNSSQIARLVSVFGKPKAVYDSSTLKFTPALTLECPTIFTPLECP